MSSRFYDQKFFEIDWNWNRDVSIMERDYLLTLEIPSIDLKQTVYSMDSPFNDVNYHVQILENSKIEEGTFFLAGHSGSGKSSYFNQLDLLEKGDLIWILIGDRRLGYVVLEKYFVKKTGYLEVDENLSQVLFLITCSLKYLDSQLVVRANLTYW